MAGNVPFLMKDVVLLAVSIYLLKQDVLRVSLAARPAGDTKLAAGVVTGASAAITKSLTAFSARASRAICCASG
jgi:hypothetical protein